MNEFLKFTYRDGREIEIPTSSLIVIQHGDEMILYAAVSRDGRFQDELLYDFKHNCLLSMTDKYGPNTEYYPIPDNCRKRIVAHEVKPERRKTREEKALENWLAATEEMAKWFKEQNDGAILEQAEYFYNQALTILLGVNSPRPQEKFEDFRKRLYTERAECQEPPAMEKGGEA